MSPKKKRKRKAGEKPTRGPLPKPRPSAGTRTPPRPRYHELADKAWAEAGATTLLVACHRVLDVAAEWREDQVEGLATPGARAFFVRRRLTYLDTAEGVYAAPTADAIITDPKLFRWPDLPEAPYLLLLSAFDDEGNFQSRSDAQREIELLLGIINSVGGRNAGEKRIFELDVDLFSGNYIGTAGPIVVSYGGPLDLSKSLNETSRALRELVELDEPQRNRVALSLRWFARGVRDAGHDAFISLWVAIETLSMQNETNVKRAVETMTRVYALDETIAIARFQLGRIQGLRSRILHEGNIPPIDERLNRYLAAVYRDLLFDILGLPPRFWVNEFPETQDFDVLRYLQALEPRA